MRKLILMAVVLGLMFTLVIGCSEDEETPVAPTITEGDLTDFDFLAAQEVFYGAEGLSDELWGWMDMFVDTIFTDSAAISGGKITGTTDEFIFTYHSTSQYWYWYVSHEDTTYNQGQEIQEIVTFVIEDSLQFLHGVNAVQWPDSNLLTGVNNGVLLTVNTQTGLGNMTAQQNLSVVGDLVYRGDIVINGTQGFEFGVSDQADNCSVSMDVNSDLDDIALNIAATEDDEECPTSGVFSHIGTIGIECTGDTTVSYSDTWTMTQTFMGDSSVVVFENSTTRWAFTDYCGDPPVTKRVADLLAAIRSRD